MASMIKHTMYPFIVFVLFSVALSTSAFDTEGERKVYIVYMGEKPHGQILTESVHLNLLDHVLDSSSSRESLVYSYTKSFNGFAAKLTEKEAQKIAELEGIVSVFPSRTLKYHTSRSWDFLKFPQNVTRKPTKESDVIIGLMDSGIWPESESFRDDGMGPPPAKWKGVCHGIKCNNKLIGARVYPSTDPTITPRDDIGHGTHTASTAAGQSVKSASLYGLAQGTARGAVPSARIAVYKVCSPQCTFDNLLAGFDDAIADGVDILSVSLGAEVAVDYLQDPLAIGAFHAMKKGIVTSASAGNAGPVSGSVTNVAPWMLVSAASSTDRHIVDKVVLGDGTTVVGSSLNTFTMKKKNYPLAYFGDPVIFPPEPCSTIIKKETVLGKIVVCSGLYLSTTAADYGAEGMVVVDDSFSDTPMSFRFPALAVTTANGMKFTSYANKTKKPVANILKSEAIFDSKAPVVASFSSRGPNALTPNILKPDISAPGIDILAAWSEKALVTGDPRDARRVKYNIISGTSMACPHVSGAAAYVKSFHPNWSSAMIMSALMTTATPMDPAKHKNAELSYGAGQINPVKATNPGLVYDATAADYTKMLCDQGYTTTQIRLITGDKSTCSSKRGNPKDLNYPSMSLHVNISKPFTGTFKRTVTNVGDPKSKYTAKISADPKIKVTVKPQFLSFKKLNEKQSFVVTVTGSLKVDSVASASVVWSDGRHSVRSVIAVHTDLSSS